MLALNLKTLLDVVTSQVISSNGQRNRNLMRKKISIKVLRWLVATFIEASKFQETTVKRWKLKEHYSEYFCTFKFNANGKYISFIAIRGINKSVIITSETKYKEGW